MNIIHVIIVLVIINILANFNPLVFILSLVVLIYYALKIRKQMQSYQEINAQIIENKDKGSVVCVDDYFYYVNKNGNLYFIEALSENEESEKAEIEKRIENASITFKKENLIDKNIFKSIEDNGIFWNWDY